MKGLEPSTFCMASSRYRIQKSGFSLQIGMISALPPPAPCSPIWSISEGFS